MKKMRITSVRNAHGLKVKKCCASCQHKCIEADGTRVCQLMQLKVQQRFKCKKWEMAEAMQNAGNSGGRIHDKAYLEYVMNIRQKESVRVAEAADKGMPLEVLKVETIRKKYALKGKPQFIEF